LSFCLEIDDGGCMWPCGQLGTLLCDQQKTTITIHSQINCYHPPATIIQELGHKKQY